MNSTNQLSYQPLISIVMPVYNTLEQFLREAIQSVLNQSYTHWELCIADDASTQPHVKRILEEYAAKDARIKGVFRSQNGHISRASNSALQLATGEFISLLDHDDLLVADALHEVVMLLNEHPDADMIYSDEDKVDDRNNVCLPCYKPDWCPDSFLSRMYTCHLGTYRRSLVNEIGGFREGFEGSQDYDLVLRLTEKTNKIFHIPKILYHWRFHPESASASREAKPYAYEAAVRTLTDAIRRRGEPGQVLTHQNYPGHYTIRYAIKSDKLVSIIIPTRDFGSILNKCLESIFTHTLYPNYEVIVIDNGSVEVETTKLIKKWQNLQPAKFKCYRLDIPFNYSRINNFGVEKSQGDYLLFLNNDTQVHQEDWLNAMVEQAQRQSIGAVGGMLLYPDNSIQNTGFILGVNGIASHAYKGISKAVPYDDMVHIGFTNNVSAVTGACLMCRREVFTSIGGFDENLPIVFSDVDLCLKMMANGYRNIYISHAKVWHQELKGWAFELTDVEQLKIEETAAKLMVARWNKFIKRDPCFSQHLVNKFNKKFNQSETSQPLVSICIPTYNGDKYLSEALCSAMAQTYPNLEIIISDDGSTDQTVAIAKSLTDKFAGHFRIWTHNQFGLVKNWNHCISQAKGKYIKLLCQDDLLEPECVAELVNLAEQDEQIGLVFSRRGVLLAGDANSDPACQAIGRGAVEISQNWSNLQPVQDGKALLAEPNLLNNPINKIGEPSTVLIRKEVFDRVGLFDVELQQLVDVEMWFRIMSCYKIGFVNKSLSHWRVHLKQLTRENLLKGEIVQDVQRLHHKILQSPYFNLLSSEVKNRMTDATQVKEWMRQLAGAQKQSVNVTENVTAVPVVPALSLEVTQISPVAPNIRRPFWSVMIPTYNRVKYLEQALKSVLQQAPSSEEMQVEVVNDCSNQSIQDEMEAIVKAVGGGRVNFYRHPEQDIGQTAIFNLCIQRSHGEWVHILHDDDVVLPGFYSRLREGIEKEPSVGAAFCRHIYTDEAGNQRWVSWLERETPGVLSDWLEQIIVMCRLQASPIAVKRSVYENLGGFCPQAGAASDWEMWKRIAVHYPIWYEPEPLAWYRQHSSSDNTRLLKSGGLIADVRRSIEISQSYLPSAIADKLSNQAREHYALYALNTAKKLLTDGDSEAAIAQIREGLKCSQSAQLKEALVSLLLLGESHQPSTGFSSSINQQQKESSNESATANSQPTRKQIADIWLNLPAEQVASAFAGDAGKQHQALLASDIRYEPLTDTEETFVSELVANVAKGFNEPKAINYLLAAMLYRRADQLPLKYDRATVPNWFANEYLKFMFTCPNVFQTRGEADSYYQFIQGWIDYLHTNLFKNADSPLWQNIALLFAQVANFIPLYFTTANLRDIYTKRAEIIEFSLKNRGSSIDCIFPARSPNRTKIRVGIINDHFAPQTETFATIPVFEHLNRNQFEIYLYALNTSGHQLEQYCQSRADKLVALPKDFTSQVQTIRADDLDILFFGTNLTAINKPLTSLAMHRLARVQTTSFCSPTTTGIRHMDYYIAGQFTAPDASYQEQYREQLAVLQGSGFCFTYATESEVATVKPTRQSLGISDNTTVFISGANFYKILPELRESWVKILAAVPDSILILYPFGPAWTRTYPATPFVNNLNAVCAKYGVNNNRLRFVKQLPSRADVKEFLQLADVYLDSYPYAGATSLIDPLQVGLPAVVVEGNALRFRQGSAMLRELQMPDLIAYDEASYIQLAVTLGTNPQLRQQKRQEIQQKMQANPACFDSVAYSGAIGKLFQELFGKWQTSHLEASHNLQDSIPKQPDLDEILSNALKLYQRNSSNISAISELRQIRKQIADFWLNVPAENLEIAYRSASGNSYQMLLKSGFQRQPMMESEQMFLQQLTQISKGLVHPKAVNALLAAMLYFPPETMRIPDARNRLPHWLIGDYEQVFETEAAVKSDSTSDLLAQYIQSRQFANQLLGCVNLYRIDPSDESVVLELRQIRKQMADFWLTVPSEKLESFYRGDVRKGYQALLSCGLQAESMTEAEQQFLQKLTEISKGLVQPQAINALLGAMLYFVPGKMRVPDARTRLPQWLLEDYEKVFESAFATTEPTLVKQDYLPQFLNQLTAAVNLYEIDPTAELVIADLRHIRKQIADLWLSVSGEQVEVFYRSDFGKGYKALLGSGFINEPLNESDREFFKSLVVELSKGFGAPKAVNNLLAAMLYCRPGQLRVEDANTCLPPWLLADYEQFVGGAIELAVK
ncbi:glycosyl transferase family 2 [Oscillatoria nigro-viridis PCC 7112]|uniref:Glycosyl transferase family 2 n=1 Tax=Phormidium nigroviride PCC 7112 TaxID=179408 RepID=K9VJF5_9CYAN|nr:glycosyltransferase [Oscillatoria nigro-viridis]AFZ08066.1 glycosyl transferase family 2 [Oscillatoria nigro-viridis PCC 7112]